MSRGKRQHGYQHQNQPMDGNKMRVRGKRLDQVDNTKLTLAYWLLAKQLVADKTDPRMPTEDEVRAKAHELARDDAEDEPDVPDRQAS
jgi:hypothetical protein